MTETFNYIKNGPNQIITIDFDPFSSSSTFIFNKPDWMQVATNGNRFEVSLNLPLVNMMPAGSYEGTLVVNEVINMDPNGQINESIFLGSWSFELNIQDRLPLSVTPDSLQFYYMIGNEMFPQDQVLTVSSEELYNFSTNQTWIQVSRGGLGSNGLIVNVTVQGLPPGTYTGEVLVEDSVDQIVIPIELVVDGEIGTEDFVFITPEVITFEYTQFGFLPAPRNVSINASGDFTIESASPWIDTSIESGNENTLSFDVSINDQTADLGIGLFVSEILVRLGSIVKTIRIEVETTIFIEELFDPNTLYFTDDENIVRLGSTALQTQLAVGITLTVQEQLFRFSYGMPFFKGESKVYIGSETRKALGALSDSEVKDQQAKVYAPYRPAVLDFQFSENVIYTDTIVRGLLLEGIRFIKGITPTNNRLTRLPDNVYITTKGVLNFSFLSNNRPDTIEITGSLQSTIPFTVEANELYSVQFPLEALNLSIGDSVTIKVGEVGFTAICKPDGIDHCVIYWENSWGCWDSFECTGKIKVAESYTYTREEYQKNRFKRTEKTLEVITREKIEVDTGWIYSEKEILFLSSMLSSRNIYLSFHGRWVKVNSLIKNMLVNSTRRFMKSFVLTFENEDR